jgi:altronate dehydratase small subunit
MSEEKSPAKDILIMNPMDNVAVCLRDIKIGEKVTFELGDETMNAIALDPIPRGHKICMREIQKDAQIIKYGEVIGKAATTINIGQHVHVHNVTDL